MKWGGIVFGLTLGAVFVRALEPVSTDDLFMYLALGRRLLTQGEFGSVDPFLFSIPDFHWYVWHEWLSYLLYYAIYDLTGFAGLIFFRAILVSVAAMLVWRAGERSSLPPWLLGCTVAIAVSGASFRCFGDRCSFLSDLLICGLIYFLTDASLCASRWKWAWPPVFLVWMQLHPGFLIGWFLLAAFITCHNRSWSRPQRRQWLLVFASCLLIPLINPQGWEGLLYPIGKIMSPEFRIFREINSEWMGTLNHYSLSTGFKIFLMIYMGISLALTGFAALRGKHFLLVSSLLVCYLGLSAIRFSALSGFALAILAGRAAGVLGLGHALRSRAASFVFGALAALGLYLTVLSMNTLFLVHGERVSSGVPVKAVRFLSEQEPGNIFNEYHTGGLLAWELNGRMKIAGHGHVDQPDLVLKRYLRFSYSRKDWEEIVIKGDVRYFLVERTTLSRNPDAGWVGELASNWKSIYSDEAWTVLRKR